MTSVFDPEAPLPGAPDPWAASGPPEWRAGPPFLMTEMIAAEPALAGRILARLAGPESVAARLAGEIGDAVMEARPIVVTGCGTSEHAAQGVAAILAEAAASQITTAQAFELALEPPPDGLVIGISHEGGTAATIRALAATVGRGGLSALITVSDRSPGAAIAHRDLVVTTEEQDQSWCHTVGYVSPLLAGTAIGGHLSGERLVARRVVERLAAGTGPDVAEGAEGIAAAFEGARTIVTVGSGVDRPAARELALKIEEGVGLPSMARDLETFLHGHLAAVSDSTGVVLVLADPLALAARVERAIGALRACRVLGAPVAAIMTEAAAAAIDGGLTPAGRIVVPQAPSGMPRVVGALFGTAGPLQLLTERLARARGTNPDLIGRDDPRQRDAAAAVSG